MKMIMRSILALMVLAVFSGCATYSPYTIHNAQFKDDDGKVYKTVSIVRLGTKKTESAWWLSGAFNRIIENGETQYIITLSSVFLGSNPDPDYKLTVYEIALNIDGEIMPLEIYHRGRGEDNLVYANYLLSQNIIEKLKRCNEFAIISPYNDDIPIAVEQEAIKAIKKLL
jgi:hypothetical protein